MEINYLACSYIVLLYSHLHFNMDNISVYGKDCGNKTVILDIPDVCLATSAIRHDVKQLFYNESKLQTKKRAIKECSCP